jgi:DNA repair protein RadD
MIKLRAYQEDALDSIWTYFANGNKGNPLISWPTGTGKSVLPAAFIERIMKVWPTQRFMLLTSVSELIKQNATVLQYIWPHAPLGIYSAGLKSKDIALPVIYAGIQSAIKNPLQFGHRDIIFIDEGHLVNQDESSMYLTFINGLKIINPNLKIIGMTATPFRMGQGLLTDGGLFTDIIHDLTGIDGFNRLIAEGYLCPLIPLRTKTEIDTSSVGMTKGEFILSQLEDAADKEKITYEGLREMVAAGQNRKSWLLFSSGIKHAEHIASMLSSFGIDCAAIHSKQKPEYNDAAIKAFKAGRLKSIVNFSKLTTGFNHPDIDLIGDFRPTMSIPLHIQKLGRGTRPANNKNNCLVLDFGRNVPRLGPINDPVIPRRKGEKQGDIPVKLCDNCGAYNHISARICCQCGEEFIFQTKLVPKAGTDAILRSDLPIIEQFNVDRVIYSQHDKIGSPQSMKVTYFCGLQSFREWICLEHPGVTGKMARDWWRQRHKSEPPKTTQEALQYMSQLRIPKRIKVWCNKKWPEIVGHEW